MSAATKFMLTTQLHYVRLAVGVEMIVVNGDSSCHLSSKRHCFSQVLRVTFE